VRAEDGDIRWVVHAAGVALRAGISEADPADIARIVAVNLTAPLLLVRELLTLPWARPASIVLVGSLSASRPLPGRSVYGAAKAGLEGAVRGLAVELAPRGIQVNAVSPGVVDTAMIAPVRPAVAAWAEQRVPAGRIGRPEEVADLIRYLCVDAPAYLTGARIPIDGGAEAAP
jgi:NAD(P)-dependent dehydrogenase (short-subunit alcohol dehydrogenase family)